MSVSEQSQGSGDDEKTGGTEHPAPWAAFDYRAARPDDEAWRDTSVPAGIPDVETSRTGFNPSDAPSGERERWQRLSEVNDGAYSSERAGQKHRGGIERDLGVITGRLGATDRQQERAQWLLDRIDIKGEILPSGAIEIAILAVVSLVIDEDRTRFGQYENAKGQSVLRDTAFAELVDEYGVTKRDVRRTRQEVRETDVYESPNSEG